MFRAVAVLLLILAHGSAQSNTSCVQVFDNSDPSVSSDNEPSLTFTLEGASSVEKNTVNVVVVVDSSPSIDPEEWELELKFAKDTVEAFAKRGIFENGGTASYVQFSGYASYEGTFNSTENFHAHVDNALQYGGGTDIVDGIVAGTDLLRITPASFGFMVLITDGEDSYSTPEEVAQTAEETRADNATIIFAVGVGDEISNSTLLGIAGEEDNVFNVNNFEELEAAVADIDATAEETVLSCPATGVTVSIEFDAPISSASSSSSSPGMSSGAVITGNRVTFTADNLEGNPTQFSVALEECGNVTSVDYEDDQGNSPDFSRLPGPACVEPSESAAAIAATVAIISTVILTALASVVEINPGGTVSLIVKKPTGGQGNLSPPQDNLKDAQDAIGEGLRLAGSAIPEEPPSSHGGQQAADGQAVRDAISAEDPSNSTTRQDAPDANNTGGVVATDAPLPSTGGSGGGTEEVVVAAAVASLSIRRPSSALVWLIVAQAQFLATLSLVDSVGLERSWLAGFLRYLRWTNLWVPIGADRIDNGSDNDIKHEDFVGNIVIVLCVAVLLLVLHVLVVSAIEGYWLQERGKLPTARNDFAQDQVPPSYREVTALPSSNVQEAPPSYDEMVDSPPAGGSGSAPTTPDDLEPVAKCRDLSKSIWIHFPNIELVFLLFAVQGALAAQVEVLHSGRVDESLFYVAAIALVAYPVLVAGIMCRVIYSRVLPEAGGMAFIETKEDDYYASSGRRGCGGFFQRVVKGLKEEHSSFAWAKTGVWKTADTDDAMERRLGDWFRIGFDPLFVSFTRSGVWFSVYSLFESYLTACVGVLLDSSSQLQLLILMVLHSVGFLLVTFRKPFANRVVNGMAACRLAINAVCMAFLVVAEIDGASVHSKRIETTVGVFEVLLLWALAVPVYADTAMVLGGAVWRRMKKTAGFCPTTQVAGPQEDGKAAGRRPCGHWWAVWLTMVRQNFAYFGKDVANGLRRRPKSA